MGAEVPSKSRLIRPHQVAIAKSLVGRFAQLIAVMVAVSLLTFLILSSTPGSVIDARIGEEASK